MFSKFLMILIVFTSLSSKSVIADSNLRIGPLHALAGVLHAELDFGIAKSWTLGPSLTYLNRDLDGYDAEAYLIGIRGNYYFNKNAFTQGWYFGPSLHYTNVKLVEENTVAGDLEGSGSGFSLTLLGGYQWMWDSFNINLGAGPVFYTLGGVEVESSDGSIKDEFSGYDGASLNIEFTMGWKF